MPAAYSYDLRKKVLNALDAGVSPSSIASQFDIGKRTIYAWQQRRKMTGDFCSKKPGNVGYGHKITDWYAFKSFAKRHGDKTQSEMAELWEGDISRQTIHRALKKIGFTRKKRHMNTRKAMKRSEKHF